MLKFINFYADWCAPCKMMEPILAEVEKEYEGKISFEEWDVEAQGEKTEKFKILRIPTFILLKNQKEQGRKVGGMTKRTLKDWLDSYLKER